MAAPKSTRGLAPFICESCRHRFVTQSRRPFTTTTIHLEDPPSSSSPPDTKSDSDSDSILTRLSSSLQRPNRPRQPTNTNPPPTPSPSSAPAAGLFTSILNRDPNSFITEEASRNFDSRRMELPHRLHVYAHKHNTHITLVQPRRTAAETMSSRLAGAKLTAAEQKKVVDTLLSLSTGNIGFRKANRGTYDAAFQLAAFTLKQMEEKGMWRDINKLEVVLRGFGAGREAVTKALLGSEGRHARTRMSAVVDATRLKQGGPRSKKPRRLG